VGSGRSRDLGLVWGAPAMDPVVSGLPAWTGAGATAARPRRASILDLARPNFGSDSEDDDDDMAPSGARATSHSMRPPRYAMSRMKMTAAARMRCNPLSHGPAMPVRSPAHSPRFSPLGGVETSPRSAGVAHLGRQLQHATALASPPGGSHAAPAPASSASLLRANPLGAAPTSSLPMTLARTNRCALSGLPSTAALSSARRPQ